MENRPLASPQPTAEERGAWQSEKFAALAALAAGMTHEFNNLLMVLLGNAELGLLTAEPNSRAKAAFEQIAGAAERGAEFCKQMMNYAGRGKRDLCPTDLNRLLGSVRDSLFTTETRATIDWQLAEPLPAIDADQGQLKRLVQQLAVNAVEALPATGGIVTVTTGMAPLDRTWHHWPPSAVFRPQPGVFLEVADDGVGMDPAIVDRVCDPYFSTKSKGRGMGLATVLSIARQHEAAISIDSRPGHGTRVRVFFPPSTSSPAQATSAPTWRGEGRAIVIDADEQSRTLAAALLEHFGFDTLLADDLAHARDLLEQSAERMAVIVLAAAWPGADASKAIEQLRALEPKARILLIGAEQVGRADGVLQKPLDAAELAARLRVLL